MPMITHRAFVDALEAISITGVVRIYDRGPPAQSPSTADTPAQYVRRPESEEGPLVFGEQGGGAPHTLRAEFVLLVEPVGQSTQQRNFDLTVDMMDNLDTGFRAATCTALSQLSWRVFQTIDTVAGQDYWAIVAAVSSSKWR